MIQIDKTNEKRIDKYYIQYDIDGISGSEVFFEYNWDKSVIINQLIRSQYPQDRVEAIINNHFLNVAEWLDLKFKGENVEFVDEEYDKFQAWRAQCKEIANEALTKYPQEI